METKQQEIKKNESGINVFTVPTGTADDLKNQEDKSDVIVDDAKKQETVEQKQIEDAKKLETTDDKETIKNDKLDDEKKSEKSKKKPFEVDFGNETDLAKQDIKNNEQPKKQETVSLTEQDVLKYVNEKFGFDIKDLSDLSKKQVLNEQVEEFRKFNDETGGRGIKDLYNLKKDWNKEPKETVITEFLKNKYPNMSSEGIETQLNAIRISDDDNDNLEPNVLNRRKADYDKVYSEALSFMTEQSKSYNLPLDNAPAKQDKPDPKLIEAQKNAQIQYWEERDSSLKGIKDSSFKIKDLGEVTTSLDDEDKKLISKRTETVEGLIGHYVQGKNINTKDLVEDVSWLIPSIRQKRIISIAEQINALTLQKMSKVNRNVDLDDLNKVNTQKNEQKVMTTFNKDENKEDSKFGQPLFNMSKTS